MNKVSELKMWSMKAIDGSDNVRYTAKVNDEYFAQMQTDGIIRPHLTLDEWRNKVANADLKDLNK